MPKEWAWTRIRSLVAKLGSGSTPHVGQRVYVESGVPFIRSQNFYNGGLRLEDVTHIDEATNKSKSGSIVCGMDLLLNITGGSIGRCAIVPSDFSEANVNQHVMIIRLIEPRFCRFIHAYVVPPFTQALILERDRRRRIRELESLAVAALRISQPMKPSQNTWLDGERRSLLRKPSLYSPLHAKAFPACPGVSDAMAYMATHDSTLRHFP